MKRSISKEALAWSMYDWANSAFSTTVIAAFFPIFFKSYWSRGVDVNVSTFYLGISHSFTSAVLAALAPILGAFADRGSKKKQILLVFTSLGILATGLLPLTPAGAWSQAIVLFVLATLGWSGANALYDALLCSVANGKRMEFISALGFALGYLGGGLLFLLNVAMVMKPDLFGLADKVEATRMSFYSVAVWWAVFSLPIFLIVREKKTEKQQKIGWKQAMTDGFRQLVTTFHELRKHQLLGLFLLSYFFYIDGVNTIIKMAVDYGMSIGLEQNSLILAILIVQFVGFPATLLFGWLAGKIGPKSSLFVCLGVYTIGTIYAFFMSSEHEFYVLAVMIGSVQGGIQSISRAVFARLIPHDQAGEFFGFYNMLGKFSAVLGPLLVGLVSLFSHDTRYSILSVILLFIIGGGLLMKVSIAEASRS